VFISSQTVQRYQCAYFQQLYAVKLLQNFAYFFPFARTINSSQVFELLSQYLQFNKVRIYCQSLRYLTSKGICSDGRGRTNDQYKRKALLEIRTYHSELFWISFNALILWTMRTLNTKVYVVNEANCLFLQKAIHRALHEVCLAIRMALNPGMFTVGLLHEVRLALEMVFRFSNVYGRLSRKTNKKIVLNFFSGSFLLRSKT